MRESFEIDILPLEYVWDRRLERDIKHAKSLHIS